MGQMVARVTILQDQEGRIVKEMTHRTPVSQEDQGVIDVAHAGRCGSRWLKLQRF